MAGWDEIADYSGTGVGTPQTLTVRGIGGVPIAAITPSSGAAVYYHNDVLGSTVAVTQAGTSGPGDTYTYSEFGVPGAGTYAAYRFAGYRYDNETNLYYVRARYLSPALGRFLQADPIGTAGGANLYSYAGNDPINNVDPTGLATLQIGFAGNGNIGLYVTYGPPPVSAGASVVGGFSVQYSPNAQTISQLSGPFVNGSVHAGAGAGGSFDVWIDPASPVWGYGITLGAAQGASASLGFTSTEICTLQGCTGPVSNVLSKPTPSQSPVSTSSGPVLNQGPLK